MSEWKKLENVDMHCFACGPENHFGLKMKFESNGEKLRSDLVVPEHLRGWSSLAHGGILATILDETMSWSAIHLFRKFILTQNMNVEFKKPVYIGEKIRSYGIVKERINKRKAVLKAEIRNAENEVCAAGQGKFVLFEPDEFKKLGLVPDSMIMDMEAMFD